MDILTYQKMDLTSEEYFMYFYKLPELEVRGAVLFYIKEIKAMKALHQEGAAFMAFLFNNLSAISSHEGYPYLPRREKTKLFGGFMGKTVCKKVATVQFWDIYAKWYKCWMEHNNYHDRIIDVLTTMVEPGWKVLIESSFAYHRLDEAFEHYSLKKGKPLSSDEITSLKAQLTYEDDHFWMKDTAYVGMYWWEKMSA